MTSAHASTPASPLVLDRSVLDTLVDCLARADLVRLLDLAATELPALADQVRAASHGRDLTSLMHQAHKLTGLAASFGAGALAETADRIERVIRAEQRAPSADMLDDMTNAVDPALRALADWRVERAL